MPSKHTGDLTLFTTALLLLLLQVPPCLKRCMMSCSTRAFSSGCATQVGRETVPYSMTLLGLGLTRHCFVSCPALVVLLCQAVG